MLLLPGIDGNRALGHSRCAGLLMALPILLLLLRVATALRCASRPAAIGILFTVAYWGPMRNITSIARASRVDSSGCPLRDDSAPPNCRD